MDNRASQPCATEKLLNIRFSPLNSETGLILIATS